MNTGPFKRCRLRRARDIRPEGPLGWVGGICALKQLLFNAECVLCLQGPFVCYRVFLLFIASKKTLSTDQP
jgi:hypothetical protein